MTPEEFSDRLQQLYGMQKDLAESAILPSVEQLLFDIKHRIVDEGKNTAGGNIGDYSTKPMYVTKQQFVKSGSFNPQGKLNSGGITKGDKLIPTVRLKQTGIKKNPVQYKNYSIVKANNIPRKSMYLAEGYKELRSIQGLRVDIVNFKYRGDLINSYQMQKVAQAVLIGLTLEKSALIRQKLEAKFGITFYATAQELDNYKRKVVFSFEGYTRQILRGEGLSVTPTVNYI